MATGVDDHIPDLCDLNGCRQQQDGWVEMEMFSASTLEPITVRLRLCGPHRTVMRRWAGLVVKVKVDGIG